MFTNKLAKILLFLLLGLFLSGFSFKDLPAPLYENIRKQALASFKELFRRDVKIQKVGGRLLGQIVLKGVEISPDLKADVVKINFSILKYIKNKGNIVPAITSLEIENGTTRIIRDKNNKINLASLFAGPKRKKGPATFPLRSKIIIKKSKVEYVDQGGIYPKIKRKDYHFNFLVKSGSIDLKNAPQLSFILDSFQDNSRVKIKGNYNLSTQKYRVDLIAKNLDLKKWGPFAIPLDVHYKNGYANLDLNVVNDLLKIRASGIVNGSSVTISGLLQDFTRPTLDFNVAFQNAPIKEAQPLIKNLARLDLKGRGDAKINIKGPANSLNYSINLNVKKGTFYKQPFTGRASLLYKNRELTISSSKIYAFRGTIITSGIINFGMLSPSINLRASSSNLNLYSLSYNSPGISGSTSATLNLSGTLDEFVGKLRANFAQASILGQTVSNAEANFIYHKGSASIKKLIFYSKDAYFKSSGSILANLETNLSAEAKGILLSGENFVGKMQAYIDNFKGELSFKLDQKFISSPIRNITAQGSIEVSRAQIAEQQIDHGSGEIYFSKGTIKIPRFEIKRRNSILYIYGQTGINAPSNLKIVSKNLDLNDAKIINLVLPDQIKDPQGSCDFDISVGGTLKSETKLTSFDPFLDLDYNGKFSLTAGSLKGVAIKSAKADFEFKNRKLNIKNARLEGNQSSIRLSLQRSNDQINLSTSGKINFQELSPFFIEYGELEGIGKFDLKYSGYISEPETVLSLNFNDFSFNRIYLGRVKTKLSINKQKLSFISPLIIESEKDKYELAGNALIGTDKNDDLDLNFKIHKASLDNLIPLSLKIVKMVGSRQRKQNGPAPHPSQFKQVALPKIFNPLYASQGEYFLKAWGIIESEIKSSREEEFPGFWKDIKGEVRAQFKIQGNSSTPVVAFASKFNDFSYKDYTFDSIEIEGNYSNKLYRFKKALLKKRRGTFLVGGTLDPKGSKNNLFLKAKNMPVDLLELVSGKNDYKGNFNLDGKLKGALTKPVASLTLLGKKLSLAGIAYKEISGEASLVNNRINLKHCVIKTGKNISRYSGTFSLKDQAINVSAVISGEGLGLINLFNKHVHYVKGEAAGKLHLSQTLAHPRLEGWLKIKNSTFDLKKLNSKLTNANLELETHNNIISLSQLNGYWIGKATRYRPNLIAAAGSFDLNTFSLNARARDTNLILNFENSFSGEIFTKNISLKGPVDNMTLSGKLAFKDGIIYLPEKATRVATTTTLRPSPLVFDLLLDFDKNMYITAGNVNTLDLSNIFMSLEFSGKNIALKGRMNKPQLIGRLDFKRGTINVLNREFELLSESKQEKYYPYDFDKLSKNYARFSPEEGPLPYLNLTGAIIVEALPTEAPTSTSSTTPKKINVHIVSHIKGVPGAVESARGLKTDFEAFIEDKSVSPPQMVRASYSETEVKILLLPEFVKSLVGISKDDVEGTDVLADYLSSRLQVIVFRDLERNLEKALGLESLTLQYNFGKDIRRNLGRGAGAGLQPLFGVGFVKGFFDRLFVEVKYSQFEGEEALGEETVAFNYEITYKLSPSLSVAYYREPLTYAGVETDYYKITLKNGVQF